MSADTLAESPLLHPSTQLPRAAEARRWLVPLLFATAASLLFSIVAVPRLDMERDVVDALERSGATAQMTPHELETKVEQGKKVTALAMYTGGAFGTALSGLASALFLWLGFRVAGSKPGFPQTFTVAVYGLVPAAIAGLLAVPALLLRGSVTTQQLAALLPSSPAALLPPGTKGPVASLLAALDVFTLWGVWIVAAGMAGVARVSLRRSLATVLVLWLAYVAVFRVALPAMGGAN
jgi:hypothetical protein